MPSSLRTHWLVRGAQSALFHYLSCAPCLAARSRKRLISESRSHRRKYRSKKKCNNKSDVSELYPGFYQNPGPGETNIGWASEIEAGPRPVLKSRSGSGGSKELVRRDSGMDGSANGNAKEGRPRIEVTAATVAVPPRVRMRS